MLVMLLARSTLKSPKAADYPRDKSWSCRLTLRPFSSQEGTGTHHGHDRYASWSCTCSSHPHAHLHAQLGRICICRPIGGCHRSIVIAAAATHRFFVWPAGRLEKDGNPPPSVRGRQSVIRQAPISWRWCALALAECRLKGFKQHVQARDRSAAHTSRTKTRPSRCLNGAAAADDQVLQQRSSGSSTRQVQGMPAGSPSCRFQGEDGEPRRASARHQAVATVVEARAVS